ncbi:hypothetical protein ABZ917_03620 [Nonomuraea wenchangensis]
MAGLDIGSGQDRAKLAAIEMVQPNEQDPAGRPLAAIAAET